MDFTLLDGFILVALAGGLLRGIAVGAVRQVASLVGLLVAFLVSIQLMHTVGTVIVSRLGVSEATAPIVGFVALFLGVQLVVMALSRLFERVLEQLSLTVLNRVAGGALGGLKAALLLSVLFLVLSGLQVPDRERRRKSVLYGPVAGVLPKTLDVASDYLPAARRASDAFGRVVRPRIRSASPDAASQGQSADGER